MIRKVIAVSMTLAIWLTAGCGPPDSTSPGPERMAPVTVKSRDHLATALGLLEVLDSQDSGTVGPQLKFALNRWLQDQELDPQWTHDPLFDSLPKSLREAGFADQLRRTTFESSDISYLQEANVVRGVANFVLEAPPDPALANWAERRLADLPEEHRTDLLAAERLFDWVVRNIQLDELLPGAEPKVEPASDASNDDGSRIRPAMQARPGPGYTASVAEVLLFGRGDAWQRARALVALARQAGIDVVILATDDPAGSGRPVPWLPAALIDGELYLFDTRLGMPIPSHGEEGIATLSQVRDDPGLLRGLDLGEGIEYPIGEDDLRRVHVLIDADPAALSWRVARLEPLIPGNNRVRLTVDPSGLAERARRCEGVAGVRLWDVPLDAHLYRLALARGRDQQNAEIQRYLYYRSAPFLSVPSLGEGRGQHLRGVFSNREITADAQAVVGAKQWYMNSITSQNRIDELDTNASLQQAMGLVRMRNEDQKTWEARLSESKRILRQAGDCATYWLGLIHYETGDLEASADWLANRVLTNDDTAWSAGARYNLARVLERLGRNDEAQRMYRADDSAQRHGSLLRARRLRREQAGEDS